MKKFEAMARKYRPIPFWSWNDKLDTEETKRQISLMDGAGMGGYFMHARGGLQTEYMGEEWFENVETAIECGKDNGIKAWAYDENGWPSGFGNGIVNGLGIEYQQKYLRMSKSKPKENVICKSGSHWFYYDVNPFYVDTLDKKVIEKFIEVAYEPYYERFGNKIEGFFTDEPQISRDGIPWSFVFEEEYWFRYRKKLSDSLEELFLPVGDYKKTRIRFWRMVTELFSDGYCKQIYEWCSARGLKLTGHLVLEESMASQITSNGACMPHYRYFHIPGMDWLGRNIYDCLTPMQVSSVAQQTGKKQVISETFALCGHNVSMAELKGIYEWQMVHGINLLCQHLQGYTLRGMRKRDYPPAMYYQQPWWGEYKRFNTAMSRVGMILSKGKVKVNVLLIHPMTTAWSMFDNGKNEGLAELDQKLLDTMKALERKHIQYHLADEVMLDRSAVTVGNKIVIGSQVYDRVIVDLCQDFLPTTHRFFEEYVLAGGKLATVDELPANDVVDNPDITYTVRYNRLYNVHYFVNTSPERKTAKINVQGERLDIYTGLQHPFSGTHEFEPWGSLMIVEDGSRNVPESEEKGKIIKLDGEFDIIKPVDNMLTLDKCDYYFDGELMEEDGYVLNITERANALERPVKIHQDYKVMIKDVPRKLDLVCETPEKFEISVNGQKIDNTPYGWVVDTSFKKINIKPYLKKGENVISFDCDFKQSDSVYENIKKAAVFESEKNKLVYDFEIEPIYLQGRFSLETKGVWKELDRNALRYRGDFVIAKPKKKIKLSHIEKQGYPFFCGKLFLEGEIDFDKNDVLEFDMKGVNVIKVKIGDVTKALLTDNRINLSEFGVTGKQKIVVRATNNLRNMMGPHHLKEGESYHVTPASFFKEPCIWNDFGKNAEKWNKGYCFCEFSI